jgi:hypothetical protein
MCLAVLALLVLAVWPAAPSLIVDSLKGVLLATGGGSTPIAGAQIWVPGTRWGVVTDSSGRFRLDVGVSGTITLAVRVCQNQVQWVRVPIPWPDSVPVQLYVAAPKGCTPPGRPAWVVNSSDTTTYRGTLYRGVGGIPLVTCEGKTLYVDLPPTLADQFQRSTTGIGDSLSVVLRGRLDTDVASQSQTTLFVAELRQTARPPATFCSPGAR